MVFKKTRPVNPPAEAVASPPTQTVTSQSADSMNAEIADIENKIAALQNQQPQIVQQAIQEVQPMQQQVPQVPAAPVQPVVEEPKKQLTVNDVLVDHEQRIIQMEAKWFRLGGI